MQMKHILKHTLTFNTQVSDIHAPFVGISTDTK